MDWRVILTTFGVIFLAELGDKTQLAAMTLAAQTRRPWAVLIGAVYGFLPLMVPPIYVSLEKLDKRLLEASADLGATPWKSFLQVTLPLSLPGVATGSMLVFILLMGDYILPQFLGGGKVYFIGNALVDLFLQSRNWPFGAAVSIALVVIMFVTIFFYMRFVLGKAGQRRVVMV